MRSPAICALASALALSACSQDPSPDAANFETPAPTPTAPSASDTESATVRSDAPPPGYSDGSGINEGYPDLTPPILTPMAERGEEGARNVLIVFARAIEMREYDQAWDLLGDTGKARWSKTRFNDLFEGLRDITVAVPTGQIEGAAGSSYYTSQAAITATDIEGRPIRLEGPIVLRRVNDVPGSSAEQRRWHIEQVDLSATH